MISKLAIVLCWIGVGASLGAQEGSVIINEFMAVNETTLRDEDGDYSDWIEIHNPGTNAVNLEGWYLTDETNNLRKWGFPNVDLPGNGFLVIFASQKDRTNPAGPLHTNFKLSSEGEYLALIDPGLNIISAFAPSFPPQLADVSYGRDRTDPRVLGFFPVATPGTPNSTAGSGFAPAVWIVLCCVTIVQRVRRALG